MQRVDFLNKENEKDLKIQTNETKTLQKKYEFVQTKSEKEPIEQKEQQLVTSDKLEFCTRFAYCQVLLFKSWVEASDKLMKKVQAEKMDQRNIDIQSLYVDIHEEIFTNLFKSPEYASNLGRMVNASMNMIKNYNILVNNFNSDYNAVYEQKHR